MLTISVLPGFNLDKKIVYGSSVFPDGKDDCSGQLYVYNKCRAIPSKNEDMYKMLSAYDRDFSITSCPWEGRKYAHINIFCSVISAMYADRVKNIKDAGILSRFVHNKAVKDNSYISRGCCNQMDPVGLMEFFVADIIVNTALEDISLSGVCCSWENGNISVQYSPLVHLLLSSVDHMVFFYL